MTATVIPGTETTAVQNADGSWNLLAVPILGAGPIPQFNGKGERAADFDCTREWMQEAITVAAQKETVQRFMGRAFEDHHASPGSQPDAGYIRPQFIEDLPLEDAKSGDVVETPVLHADLIAVPDEVYQRVKANRLPYRSIESYPPSGFIHGLALMATRDPRFRLPMLTIATEIRSSATDEATPRAYEVLACASAERAVSVFKDAKVSEVQLEIAEVTTGIETEFDSIMLAMADSDEHGEEQSARVQAVIKRISEFKGTADEVAELVHALQQWIANVGQGGHEQDQEDKLGGPPAEQEKTKMSKAKAEAPETTKVDDVEETPATTTDTPATPEGDALKIAMAAEAKADLATAETAKVKAEREEEKAIAAAARELTAYNIGSDPVAVLTEKVEKYGVKSLPLYIETVKAQGEKSPENDSTDAEADAAAELVDLPEECNAFAGEDREVAIKASREYDHYVANDWPVDDRKTWIDTRVARAKAERK